MANPKIKFIHLCEQFILDKNNRLSIINIFTTIYAPKLPIVQPKVVIVGYVSNLEDKKKVSVGFRIIDPKKDKIAESEIELTDHDETGGGGFVAEINGIVLKHEGEYLFNVTLDKVESEKIPIIVKVTSDAQNHQQ